MGQVLKDHGVKYLFCLSGGHISPILVAAEKQNIRVVDVRHEVFDALLLVSLDRICVVFCIYFSEKEYPCSISEAFLKTMGVFT